MFTSTDNGQDKHKHKVNQVNICFGMTANVANELLTHGRSDHDFRR